MMNLIKVVIIEDDEIIRMGYQFLINEEEGCQVIASYGSVEDALRTIHNDNPDVILLDIELPGINGIDAIPKLKKVHPKAAVLILTVYDSEKTIFDALAHGAAGYLTKDSVPNKIVAAIQEAYEGGGPMSVNIARIVIKSFQKSQDSPLSKRETQVLEMISSGKTRSQIATELFIDFETVRSHIKNIYLKLNVNSRADALQTARNNKFI